MSKEWHQNMLYKHVLYKNLEVGWESASKKMLDVKVIGKINLR